MTVPFPFSTSAPRDHKMVVDRSAILKDIRAHRGAVNGQWTANTLGGTRHISRAQPPAGHRTHLPSSVGDPRP